MESQSDEDAFADALERLKQNKLEALKAERERHAQDVRNVVVQAPWSIAAMLGQEDLLGPRNDMSNLRGISAEENARALHAYYGRYWSSK